jgi:hypothetical protein
MLTSVGLIINQYLRMIENRFVTTESSFVDMTAWDAGVDPNLKPVSLTSAKRKRHFLPASFRISGAVFFAPSICWRKLRVLLVRLMRRQIGMTTKPQINL